MVKTPVDVPKLGRPKEFEERLNLSLTTAMLQAIDEVRAPGEPRLDVIRSAIEREVKRRRRAPG